MFPTEADHRGIRHMRSCEKEWLLKMECQPRLSSSHFMALENRRSHSMKPSPLHFGERSANFTFKTPSFA